MKELEDRGIGRPSTYASVIETILRARLRVEEGHRARPHVDGVREGAAARALLRAPHRLRVHRDDGGGARRHRARRGRSREVAPLLLLRQRPGRACASSWRRSTSRRSTRPRSTRCTSGSTRDGRELIVRVWPNGANIERGDEKGADPGRPRARRAHAREGRGAPRRGQRRPPRARHRSRDRPHRARAHRSLRSVRAARRAGAWLEGEAASGRRCSRRWIPTAVTLEQALALLSLPRVVGVDDRRRGDHRAERSLRALPQEGHRQPQPRAPRTQLFSVTLEQAKAIFAQPKQRRGRGARSLRSPSSAPHPESGAPVRVLDGRFGPYITDGTINASVPRGTDPETVTLEQAVELLRERAARAPATKKAPAKRAAKKATKKAAPPRSPRPRARSRSGPPRRRQATPRRPRPPPPARRRNRLLRVRDADDRRARRFSREAPFIPSDASEPPMPRGAVAGLRHQGVLPALDRRRSSRASATGSASSPSSPSRRGCPTTRAPRSAW